MIAPRPATPDPRPRRGRHGGRRPGAGAPKGNLNAMKSGKYSKRIIGLRVAMLTMPQTTELLRRLTRGKRRRMELLAHALHFYADMLMAIAKGASLDDLKNPELRRRALLMKSLAEEEARSPKRSSRETMTPETTASERRESDS